LLAALLFTMAASPLAADTRSDAKKQVEFGISVAQKGLWREAIYRWERATEIDPTYAAAHNNLAIAYEHEGELDKARAGVRESAATRAEQQLHQTELRTVQGNQ
jgi:Flp pilus assembly protein TadD